MTIVRNDDGTLLVPVRQERHHDEEEVAGETTMATDSTRVLHPGEGGYDEALVEWDLQQNPDREPAVSTPSGRQEAMALVHAMAESPKHDVSTAIGAINDPEASGEALRHVLIGGVHSVEDFTVEVAEVEGGEALSAHEATKIIGEVLSELDS
jgi:signal transduction protein with GAF and PtsI domain